MILDGNLIIIQKQEMHMLLLILSASLIIDGVANLAALLWGGERTLYPWTSKLQSSSLAIASKWAIIISRLCLLLTQWQTAASNLVDVVEVGIPLNFHFCATSPGASYHMGHE